jgi:preprotein translocase subunit SecD
MRWRWVSWLILCVVLAVATAAPAYRHFYLHKPIIKLGLDLAGGVEVELQAVPDDRHTPTPIDMIRMLRKGIDPKGTKDITIAQVGKDRIQLQLPGESDPDTLLSILDLIDRPIQQR